MYCSLFKKELFPLTPRDQITSGNIITMMNRKVLELKINDDRTSI